MNTRIIYSMILVPESIQLLLKGEFRANEEAGWIRCHPGIDTDGLPVMTGLHFIGDIL